MTMIVLMQKFNMGVQIVFQLVYLIIFQLNSCQAVDNLIWNKELHNFVPLSSILEFEILLCERKNIYKELEFHDFNGEPVRVATYTVTNLIEFYDNDTKITGLFGDFWTELSEYLNFRLQPIKSNSNAFGEKLPNGSYTDLYGLMQRDEADAVAYITLFADYFDIMKYTTPFGTTEFNLWLRPVLRYNQNWLAKLLPIEIIGVVFFIMLLFISLGYTYQYFFNRYCYELKTTYPIYDYIFFVFSTFVSQGTPSEFHDNSKIYSYTRNIFCFLVVAFFNAYLYSFLTDQTPAQPFHDFESMFKKSSYSLVSTKRQVEIISRIVPDHWIKKRVRKINMFEDLEETMCDNQHNTYAFVSGRWRLNYLIFPCSIRSIGQSFLNSWIGPAVRKNYKYKRSIDNGILKLHEFGLLDYWKKNHSYVHLRNTLPPPVTNPIMLDQVHSILEILIAGAIMSFIILIAECVLNFFHSKLHSSYEFNSV